MKTCPFCAEEIQDAAIVCKHCGRDIVARGMQATGITTTVTTPAALAVSKVRRGLALVAIIVGFSMTISSATAGVGVLLLWLGFGFGLTGSAIARWGGGFLLALILGAVGTVMGGASPESSNSTRSAGRVASAPAPAMPKLALLASSGYESEYGGYHYIEGQVQNISDESLKNVMVVGIWMDKEGNFIKSDDAMIDYNPILPGQTSPFKTFSTGNPAMAKYRVEFKTMFGSTLAVSDRRKK